MALKTRAAFFNVAHRHPDQPPLSDLAPGLEHHRRADPAQQGDRRRERLRAREPASTSTACSSTARPTRSCGRRMSACRAATWCSASTAAVTRSASACRSSASSSTSSSSTACSRSSRRSPTRRRNCSTATSRRWCCAPKARRSGPWTLVELGPSSATAAAPRDAVVTLQHADGRVAERTRQRRRPGRCRLQGHRGGDRHRGHAAQVRGARA